MTDMTEKQEAMVTKLEKKGFRFSKVGQFGDAYLSRKKGYTTYLAQVDENGLVNGGTLEDYMKGVK